MTMPRRAVFSLAVALFPLLCLISCAEDARVVSASGLLPDGGDERASLRFTMNRRSVRVEALLRIDAGKVVVTIDHPDGRTSEVLPFQGPGVFEVRKELPKEPGNWGIGIVAKGGEAAYWYAFHDSGSYLGVDDETRRQIAVE